jgi:cell wall-associated NlpC family hydrolase
MLTRADIVTEARTWLGVSWRHQGRSRHSGVDCVGLVVETAKALDLSDRDEKTYTRHAQGQNFLRPFQEEMDQISIEDIGPGDMLMLADKQYPCHVALVSEQHGVLHIIHAHASRRKVLEEALNDEWRSKIRRAFRFRGVAE